MKKILFVLAGFCISGLSAQFNITLQADPAFTPKEAYFYTLNGSKDILISKETKKGTQWNLKLKEPYMGMMKIYFPENNYTLNFISENKDVSIALSSEGNRVKEVIYKDESNRVMDEAQDLQMKKEKLLPAYYDLLTYYRPSHPFYAALEKEIQNLNRTVSVDGTKHPFIDYYTKNYRKFLVVAAGQPKPAQNDIISFISGSGEMLESSSLMRPLLISYLQSGGEFEPLVDKMLTAVNVESPRGQAVLSELIEIFDAYGMNTLKDKYLTEAKNLKCTIFDRLATTLETAAKMDLGATLENHTFTAAKHTAAKSLYDVKADKKVLVFWSSTCSHCEKELPQFIPLYAAMKAKNIEIIGLSLDADKASYERAAGNYPWISDSELKGWNSSVSAKYNIHATPTYLILDSSNKIVSKPNHISDVFAYLGLK